MASLFKKINKNSLYVYATIYMCVLLINLICSITTGMNIFKFFAVRLVEVHGDFFASYIYASFGYDQTIQHPYQPMAHLLYVILGNVMDVPAITRKFTLATNISSSIYNIVPAIITGIIIFKYLKDNLNKIKFRYIVLLMLVFTGPFFSSLRVSNLAYPSLFLSMFFVLYYNSDNKKISEIALLSLAVAANLRVTPGIFSVMLIMDKQYKKFIKFIIYGIILYLLSTIFIMPWMSYFERIELCISSLLNYSNVYEYNKIGGCTIIYYLIQHLNALGMSINGDVICGILSKIVLLIVLISYFRADNIFERVELLCIAPLFLGPSAYHIFAIFVIPIIIYVKLYNNELVRYHIDFVLLSFILCVPIILFAFPVEKLQLSIHSIVVTVLLDLLLVKSLYNVLLSHRKGQF